MDNMQRRSISEPVKLREAETGDARKLVGYAARFGVLSEDLGGFRERIEPGFFSNALKRADDIYALFNHDENYILGERNAGTLRLSEDAKGLAFEIDLPTNGLALDAIMSPLERGELKGNSFGFVLRADGYYWDKDEDGDIAVLREGGAERLFDVSPVTYPAYQGNPLMLRSLQNAKAPGALMRKDNTLILQLNLKRRRLRYAR